MPTGHKITFTLNRQAHEGNDCSVISRLLRTHSIYIIYNRFHACIASCVPKTKKNPTEKPKTHRRFIGSWGLTDSLLSRKKRHFLGDGWQQSALTKNSEPVCLWQWGEFKAWVLKQKDHYWTMLSPERCPHNLRLLCSQHQKYAESWSRLKVCFSVLQGFDSKVTPE